MNWHKNIAVFFLVFFYSASLVGLGWNERYCHGEHLKSYWFVFSHEKCCCSADKDMGCCENKAQLFRIKDDHVAKIAGLEIGNPVTLLLKNIYTCSTPLIPYQNSLFKLVVYNDLPPPDFGEKNQSFHRIFITCRNFRI